MWACYVMALYQSLRKGGEFVKQGPYPLLAGDWQYGKSYIVLGEYNSELEMLENKGEQISLVILEKHIDPLDSTGISIFRVNP